MAISETACELVVDLARRARGLGAIVLFDPNFRPALPDTPEAAPRASATCSRRRLVPDRRGRGAAPVGRRGDPRARRAPGRRARRDRRRRHVPCPREVAVVDAIGAGDAFAAGFAYGLLEGWAPTDCAHAGNVLAARALAGTGDWETLPSSRDVEAELVRRGLTESGRDERLDVAPGLWIWRGGHPDWKPGLAVAGGGHVDLRRVGRRGRRCSTRSRRPTTRPRSGSGSTHGRRRRSSPQAGPRPGRRPLRRALRLPRVRAALVLARQHPRDRARGDPAGRRAAGWAGRALRRPRPQRDAALAPRAASARLRGRDHRARTASCGSGGRRGTRSGCSRRSARCSTCRSST